MRRKYFGLAIAAFATLGPMQAWGGDREIAEQIIKRLKTNRDSGALKDFTLDMKVDKGVVLFRGNVSQDSQKDLVLSAAQGIEGIAKVVDEVSVGGASVVQVSEPQVAAAAAPVSVATVPAAKLLTANVKTAAQEEPVNRKTSTTRKGEFSFREALAAQANAISAPRRFSWK